MTRGAALDASGYPTATQDQEPAQRPLSVRERRVLKLLADGEWHPTPELGCSRYLLVGLWIRGLIDGAMFGSGGTLGDQIWRLKPAPDDFTNP